ncbi:MAG: ATP synthase gamma chain [Candidatus Woesebacteria bacterium GW2011_GWB1_38_5]|uniref:ATP synthase gamma chain n=4 Tax=Candidatus Woeseibacteriota TaxID=1752722 RepID=A0A0G0KBN8_9BACT|nr:MAG: ATP synthase gamma chain [Candidatus Woesebacteria bacterium GW2011_GWD1_38_10]KKQ54985.1 MAG: ATP synthase gamma chain [Candidatus Woesebacteria bacterium GW2011_GWC1_38_13]KKQ72905.1 MAG: ATP synthase gamma chain [Candidatus Woesebacteria bacterium GW2011_GWB1_38_5]KKQ76407.1 MAG: ATP synthase gamma chain [Microgenomates group bacterium GW2011_GWF1_38_5]KKQ82779.1 MAG: ATP synthase gamma chain [Candidatus Woesebacteria bacterium GW2011_GWA1_38_8]
MANQKAIKKRLSSVKNIKKISKALEMVAASKVQKAQEKALASKPFADRIFELMQRLDSKVSEKEIPLLRKDKITGNRLFIIVTSDRGLCGSLNSNLLRHISSFLENFKDGTNYFITVGKKGRFFSLEHGELLADFSDAKPKESAVTYITRSAMDEFLEKRIDSVYIVYSDFVSALNQEAKVKQILPLVGNKKAGFEEEKNIKNGSKYTYEPDETELLNMVIPFYLETQVRDVIFESEASEHSARMVAMKNATDNADNLSYNLNLQYNKIRQQAITTEISDIVTASASLTK